MTEYDVVEYPHQPFAQVQPDLLAVLGALYGMSPRSPADCRVLELGCGSAGSLVALADLHPASSFLGVDLSRAAIEQGRKRSAALGLANLRLEQMDLMAFPAQAGEFDYIIAHGLFSWVPAPVRTRLLQICQRHLAPQGIAYVSYDAYPGCRIRQMWRDIMLFHTAQFDDPKDKVDQARKIVRLIAYGTRRKDAAHRLAQEEVVARLDRLRDSSIFHDDLAPVWQPFLFHDFVSLAADHDLQYLAEASYRDMQASGIRGEAAQLLQSLQASDRIGYEQYLDFFRMRRFRQTLLCRRAVDLRPAPDLARLTEFHYSAPLSAVQAAAPAIPADAQCWRNDSNAVTATTSDPIGLGALAAIAAAWPATLSFAELAAAGAERDHLCQCLHAYYTSGMIDAQAIARPAARVAGERPQVWRVARLEAALTASIPNLHLGVIELNDESTLGLLPLCDGSRTRSELAAAVGGSDALQTILADLARKALLTP